MAGLTQTKQRGWRFREHIITTPSGHNVRSSLPTMFVDGQTMGYRNEYGEERVTTGTHNLPN